MDGYADEELSFRKIQTMKAFKDMNMNEYQVLQRKAQSVPRSAFPKYCQELSGYEFYFGGRQVFKWELFDWGYRDWEMLMDNETDIRAIHVVDY